VSDRRATAAVVTACVLWGVSFPLSKWALVELSPAHLVVLRFAIAALPLGFLLTRGGARLRARDLPLVVGTGVLCVPVTYLLQFAGLARTSVTSASLIVATAVPMLALAGRIFDRERLGGIGWTAVALSTVGAGAMIGLPGPGRTWLGDALVFASIVVSVAWMMLGKRLAIRHGAPVATAWILVSGTLVLIPVVGVTEGMVPLRLSATTWACVAALALGSTFGAFVLWNRGVREIEVGRAGVYVNLEPVVGAAAGIALFGDALTPSLVGGGIAVLIGAGLATRPRRSSSRRREVPGEGVAPAAAHARPS